jgi:nicotinate-nucleotide adenylyltransferase
LGGTFDPIHYGHLRLAEEIGQALGLNEVRLMPAGTPPHRATPTANAAHRRAMVELAIAGNPRLRLEAIELGKTGPCYMVDTLATLRLELGPDTPIILIVGADAFASLDTWHEWRQLFRLCHFAVARRAGYDAWETRLSAELSGTYHHGQVDAAQELMALPAGRVICREFTLLDISASRIRADLASGLSTRYLLPDPVLDYIVRHRIYR